MSVWKNLAGTLETAFRVGKGKATIDAAALTAARTFSLPDYGGTLAILGAQAFTGAQSVAPVALTSGTTVNTNASLSNNFHLAQAHNITLANPTNLVSGTTYVWRLTQDATGGRTIAFGNLFKWPGGTVPTWVTTANAVNVITAYYDGTSLLANGAAGYA